MKDFIAIFLMAAIVLMASISFAATTVTCDWNPSTEYDLAGYRFYLVNRVNPLDVYRIAVIPATAMNNKSVATLKFNVPGGAGYNLVMTAFDNANNESARSRPAINANTRKIAVFRNVKAPKQPVSPLVIPK